MLCCHSLSLSLSLSVCAVLSVLCFIIPVTVSVNSVILCSDYKAIAACILAVSYMSNMIIIYQIHVGDRVPGLVVLCMSCRYVKWNDWYGLIRWKVIVA